MKKLNSGKLRWILAFAGLWMWGTKQDIYAQVARSPFVLGIPTGVKTFQVGATVTVPANECWAFDGYAAASNQNFVAPGPIGIGPLQAMLGRFNIQSVTTVAPSGLIIPPNTTFQCLSGFFSSSGGQIFLVFTVFDLTPTVPASDEDALKAQYEAQVADLKKVFVASLTQSVQNAIKDITVQMIREDLQKQFQDQIDSLWDPLESTCRHASLSIL